MEKRLFYHLFFLLFLSLSPLKTLTAQTTVPIDSTFGVNGLVKSNIQTHSDGYVYKLLLQPDGKIISVGVYFGKKNYDHLYACRYNPDGSPDLAFGDQGTQRINSIGGRKLDFYIQDLLDAALQPDGKIVIAGGFYFTNDAYVLRLNTDGSPDNTFGANGVALVENFGNSNYIALKSVVCQPDGRIIAGGFIQRLGGMLQDGFLFRLQADGSLDPSYGDSGRVILDDGPVTPLIGGLAFQPDGKLLVSGSIAGQGAILVRRNADGSADATFNGNGIAQEVALSDIYSMALLSDGKVLVEGRSPDQSQTTLFRFSATGEVDSTYGVSGSVSISALPFSASSDMLVLPDGRIIINGGIAPSSGTKMRLCRLDPNGILDPSFGTAGILEPDMAMSKYAHSGIALQPDGNILVGGSLFRHEGLESGIIRLLPDGAPDPAFNGTGTVFFSPTDGFQTVTRTILLPDQHTVTSSYVPELETGTAYRAAGILQSYDAQGNPDNAFGSGSGVVFDDNSPIAEGPLFKNIFQRPGGKILATATSTPYLNASQQQETTSFLCRYLADGTRDLSFYQTGAFAFTDEPYKSALSPVGVSLPDGKLLLTGVKDKQLFLIRLTQDDQFDTSFGSNGFLTMDLPAANSLQSAILQPDGKIILTGWSTSPANDKSYLLIRLNPDGDLDHSWGSNKGYISNRFEPLRNSLASCSAVQADGKIVVSGTYQVPLPAPATTDRVQANVLARFNADGTKDLSFGNNGRVDLPMPNTNRLGILSVVLQPDGKILAAGHYADTEEDILVLRYNPDGTPDNSFGLAGALRLDSGAPEEEAQQLIMLPNGKILVSGESNGQAFLLRLLSGLVVDASDLASGPGSTLVYPNPIRQQTMLTYTLPEASAVSLALFDQQGRMVQTFLNNEKRPAGACQEQLRLSAGLAAGVYTLQLRTSVGQAAIRVVVTP